MFIVVIADLVEVVIFCWHWLIFIWIYIIKFTFKKLFVTLMVINFRSFSFECIEDQFLFRNELCTSITMNCDEESDFRWLHPHPPFPTNIPDALNTVKSTLTSPLPSNNYFSFIKHNKLHNANLMRVKLAQWYSAGAITQMLP